MLAKPIFFTLNPKCKDVLTFNEYEHLEACMRNLPYSILQYIEAETIEKCIELCNDTVINFLNKFMPILDEKSTRFKVQDCISYKIKYLVPEKYQNQEFFITFKENNNEQ